jgi:hypothetical protein
MGTQLRSYEHDDPVFVSLTKEYPGPFGEVDMAFFPWYNES